MRWSAEKLRWTLLGGVLLLAAVIAALFGLANYRAGKVWQRILARNGVNLQRETNGITWSQSVKGRTVFTLHAAKTIPHGNGNWSMQDGVLILYGKDNHSDRIYGSQFEYDETNGILRALGEVHMDLQAPVPGSAARAPGTKPDFSFLPGDKAGLDPAVIHVRTSGLVYLRKLGTAATQQPTEFRYKGLTCTSRGAEFNSEDNTVHLLAEVRLTGNLRNEPFTLTASRADLDRESRTADLQSAEVISEGRRASAGHAVLHLRQDGSLQAAEASGDVQLHSKTETLTAPQLNATFRDQNRPEHALLRGGVTLSGSDPARPLQAQARSVDLTMNELGLLTTAVAEGGASAVLKEIAADGATAMRQLQAQKAVASFVPDGSRRRSVLRTLHMTGAAQAEAQTPGSGTDKGVSETRVDADELTTTFAPGLNAKPVPQRTTGLGHTRLQQTAADRRQQWSTGDALEVNFEAGQSGASRTGVRLEVASAVQTGHVMLSSSQGASRSDPGTTQPSTGHADRASFDGAAGTLTLSASGSAPAALDDGQAQVRAPAIVLHQGSGDAEASGGVSVTTGGAGSSSATHVLAARASLVRATNLSTFFGTDAQPAQLWQGGSQVQAAQIVLDGHRRTLSARPEGSSGLVHAVFVSQEGAGGSHESPARAPRPGGGALGAGKLPEASRDAVRVSARAMDFNDAQHEATFNGQVMMQGAQAQVTGAHGAAFLQATTTASAHRVAPGPAGASPPVDLSGRLERMLVLGDVRVQQMDRVGTGEQLTYVSATDSFVLTGTAANPPRVQDPRQGTVTGATLLFRAADSSIVVAGHKDTEKPARIHIETDLKQQ